MSFLEKEPNRFECEDEETGEWRECSKQEICDRHLPKDKYRADESDPEYFDNWVEKFDLLCEPKWKVGLLGSCFFIGVLLTIIIVPKLADVYGRRPLFLITMYVSIFAQIGIMIVEDLYWAYFFMILNGSTFAGKNVVGTNYLLEFQLKINRERVMSIKLAFSSIALIF